MGGKDNLVMMCEAFDFEQTPKGLNFTVKPYQVTIKHAESFIYGKMYDIYFTDINTKSDYKYHYVCDWYIPDIFSRFTGYSLSF